MSKEVWEVDLRSRKTGNSIETIFSGEHDAACDYIQEWYENNDIPGYVDGMSFENLHDGSEGVFADLYERILNIESKVLVMGHTIIYNLDIRKNRKKVLLWQTL